MNQELLNQFLSLLEASESFRLIDPEQQAAIKASYQNATDEELQQGIDTFKADQVASQASAAEDEKRETELGNEINHIKTAIRGAERDERKEEEAVGDAADKKEEEALLNEIETMKDPNKVEAPAKKRKKFLGIF